MLSDAVRSKTLERAAERIADEVAATYPFHPSLKTVVATFKDNESFRQTRGLMTIAALMITSVQKRKTNDVYLIGPQHLDLADRNIRDTINNIYDLDAAITVDILDTGFFRKDYERTGRINNMVKDLASVQDWPGNPTRRCH